ncbi:MAG: GNAT family N-acetyltransferase [Gammaproteobacteria bacterium]|nr:GNAT family N-acetyltransferase [Gammaproteobacteria bacterium]
MIIRPMTLDDYDALIALWTSADGVQLRHADSREGIQRYLIRNPGLSFVAEEGALLRGSIMAGHDGKRGYLQHLAVTLTHRRQGLGRQLVERSLDALLKEGIQKSHVHVLSNNASAQAFWTRLGWQRRTDIETYSVILEGDANA